MRNRITSGPSKKIIVDQAFLSTMSTIKTNETNKKSSHKLPQVLFITSFPPRECGIATYSEDLIKALNDKFENSFKIKICALENDTEMHQYPKDVKYILNTQHKAAFKSLAKVINKNERIKMVVLQHEFGFYAESKNEFIDFLKDIQKTKVTVFHTVLPNVGDDFKKNVQEIEKRLTMRMARAGGLYSCSDSSSSSSTKKANDMF